MRVRFWMKVFVVVPALCLAGLSAAARPQDSSQQQTGDAVADAARKAREAKKDAPKPKKVITDDDLKTSGPRSDWRPLRPQSMRPERQLRQQGKPQQTALSPETLPNLATHPKKIRIVRRPGGLGLRMRTIRLPRPKKNSIF
jgi:hypothetical protein